MTKIRVNDLARELGVKSRLIIKALSELGENIKKTHSSSVDKTTAEKIREHFRTKSGRGPLSVRLKVQPSRASGIPLEINHRQSEALSSDQSRPPDIGEGIVKEVEQPTTLITRDLRQILIEKGLIRPAQPSSRMQRRLVQPHSVMPIDKKAPIYRNAKLRKQRSPIYRSEVARKKLQQGLIEVQKSPKRKRPSRPVTHEKIIFTEISKPIEKPDTRTLCKQCGAKVFPHAMTLHIANNHPVEKAICLPISLQGSFHSLCCLLVIGIFGSCSNFTGERPSRAHIDFLSRLSIGTALSR